MRFSLKKRGRGEEGEAREGVKLRQWASNQKRSWRGGDNPKWERISGKESHKIANQSPGSPGSLAERG